MRLRFLDFDFSEDTDGVGAFDALASVTVLYWSPLQAEVAQVLDWARLHWGDSAPLDEGGAWDVALDTFEELVQEQMRHTLSLTLSGTPAFCQAMREQWGLDEAD